MSQCPRANEMPDGRTESGDAARDRADPYKDPERDQRDQCPACGEHEIHHSGTLKRLATLRQAGHDPVGETRYARYGAGIGQGCEKRPIVFEPPAARPAVFQMGVNLPGAGYFVYFLIAIKAAKSE